MKKTRNLLLMLGVVSLCACASTPKMSSDFAEERPSVKVVVMKPDVEVLFDKVGGTDLRADWTQTAEANLKTAIINHLKGSGEDVIEFNTISSSVGDIDQLIALNEQVAAAMGKHVVTIGTTPFLGTLPHKKDNKDELTYSLGESVDPIKLASNADYAAFLTYRAVIESGGSFLTKVAIGSLTGYVPAATDFRGTLISLVNLDSGEIVWLNSHAAGSLFAGDARNPDNAQKVVGKILDKGPFVDTVP